MHPPVSHSETVFNGAVWNVVRERFELDGATIAREFISHSGAVAIMAIDERDRVLLIKQYRHPIRARDWELPAGLLDVRGESPVIAAQRELAEEADLVAEEWSLLCDFASSPGGSNEAIRVYLARDVRAAPEVHERTDEEAGIEVRWVPLDDLVNAILERRVQNSILIIAALTAHAARNRGWDSLGNADSPWPWHPLNRAEH
ncbi:MAG: NUDIX hydrolase [Salinibacterium sp.]|nr:NUDIX hydrolase [Salinibacterium sp.]